jgi:hypothetical protein
MSTITMNAPQSTPRVLGALLVLLAVLALAASMTLPALNHHAVENHGSDASTARQHVQSLGDKARYCRWECPDGRTRYACGMPGGKWAVLIMAGDAIITAFTTNDRDYVLGMIDPCTNHWRYTH